MSGKSARSALLAVDDATQELRRRKLIRRGHAIGVPATIALFGFMVYFCVLTVGEVVQIAPILGAIVALFAAGGLIVAWFEKENFSAVRKAERKLDDAHDHLMNVQMGDTK